MMLVIRCSLENMSAEKTLAKAEECNDSAADNINSKTKFQELVILNCFEHFFGKLPIPVDF